MPNIVGTQILRSIDWALCKAAAATFNTIQHFNKRNPNPSVTPQWSDKPLLKSWEKTKPTLGFPRQTDSLCPACVKEARESIIAGKKTPLLSPRHAATLRVRLSKKGRYPYRSTIPGQASAGMKGTFLVVATTTPPVTATTKI